MDGERVSQGPLQIGVHPPAQGQGRYQVAEAVMKEHQVGRFPRHGGTPPAHGHTDVGRLEGRRIIHAVTGHGHHGTAGQRR
jgi:hypothetical protein